MDKNASPLVSKLPNVKTTIFTVMSKLAAEHGAINLAQGFPEFDCALKLRELVSKYLNSGFNQYAPMAGVPTLREAIAQKVLNIHNAQYDPENEITVVPGATYGIFTAIAAYVRPGDEVIVVEPAYDSYAPGVQLNGGTPVYVRLSYPDFKLDFEELRAAITPKTRMLIINTPHNPTGSLLYADDMRRLGELLKGTNVIVVSDEVYEHMVFDGEEHQSVARFKDLAARSLIFASFGKTYHVTGWKIGYVLAPRELTNEFRKAHQYNAFTTNSFLQHAIAEYLQDKEAYLSLSEFYQQKRDYFIEAIKGSRFKALPCKGSYFQLLDYQSITDENDYDFAVRLTKERKIAAIPVSSFFHEEIHHRVLRFCFAKNDDTLSRAGEILQKL